MTPLEPIWPAAPRLVPGRALPRYRFVPGELPHPRTNPAGSLHGEPQYAPGLAPQRWSEDETYRFGVDLYHAGYLWESHEAFEACYHAAVGAHRSLLQGLIQLAAALLQVHRGRAKGARTLARRARARLRDAAARVAAGERVAGLEPREIADDLERHLPGAFAEPPARVADRAPGPDDVLATVGPAPRLRLR